jgi:predicted CXXCH cytochrome family protein
MKKGICLILALFLASVFGPDSLALAMDDAECVACHGDADMVGDRLIDAARFDTTAHSAIGCSACHAGIDDTHPDGAATPARTSCGDCHDDIADQYARSNHADFASCGECHNPHEVRAPTEVSGYDMNRQCAVCHDFGAVVASHSPWLTQAELHITSLPCIACHTDSPELVITLYMVERQPDARFGSLDRRGDFQPASRQSLQALAGDSDFARLIDQDGDGIVSLGELRAFNRDRRYRGVRLQVMMMPERVSHDLSTLDNRWDCTFCHASGPEAMQKSFLAMPTVDGTFSRRPVERGAPLEALGAIPDFYMMGATRNRTLDYIGLAIVAGGLVMPIGHGSLRLLTRRNRRKGDHRHE